jgi:2-succinyl-5-enolpyruvyl-6-hydroxy-3-cyclohexene-1-carboxylate synthase
MKASGAFSAKASNINLLWASIFIEELIRNGITDFCIAPGSRSTPLTLAVANHPCANAHIHFDERGLGFLALGLSQASQKPVVIITTSGSAVANLYPAVIEARQSGLPLIIISADRPATLIDCGANQAIEQQNIFSSYPIFFAQILQPSIEINANYLLTTIDHGLNKQQNNPAPIHFNIAFEEPLYPTDDMIDYQPYLNSLKKWPDHDQPFTQFRKNENLILQNSSELSGKKILVVMAKMANRVQEKALNQFCKNNNLVLVSDIQSSQCSAVNNLHYYDLLLTNDTFKNLLRQADIIIQFGEQLISKRLSTFIQNVNAELQQVSPSESRIDPHHQLDIRFSCNATQWIDAQIIQPSHTNHEWYNAVHQCHNKIAHQIIKPFLNIQPFSEMKVVEQLDKQLLQDSPLFIGNSMPIRLADSLMVENKSHIYTNRGASGIDGLLATAIGIAKHSRKTTTLLIGDNSFLYDLNSLALIKQLENTFIIIVINNDGGSIFNQLPVPMIQKESFYQLPHGLNFKSSCEQFCIDYYNPNQIIDFEATYNKCLQGKHSLIEVTFENQQSATQLEQLKEQIRYATIQTTTRCEQ